MPVDFGTFAEIGVSLVSQNGNILTLATCDVTFSSPIPQPTSFILDANYWNNFPPPSGIVVKPVLEFDGVDQLPTANVAFGVDIKLQDGSVSEDYNYLAYTEALSGGSGGGDVPTLSITGGSISSRLISGEVVILILTDDTYTLPLRESVDAAFFYNIKNASGFDVDVYAATGETIEGEAFQTVADGDNMKIMVGTTEFKII